MLHALPRTLRNSVCPHDCPSTCALEVEVLDGRRIGAVRGAADNRLHRRRHLREGRALRRAHPPSRPADPPAAAHRAEGLRPVPRRSAWDEALDRIADAITHDRRRSTARRRCGRSTTPARWGWCSATASTGCATSMRYSRQLMTICTSICGGRLACRRRRRHRAPDPREMAKSDLIVMWGGNPVATQVNVMTHVDARAEGARGEAGGGRSVPHRHRGGRRHAPRAAARHRRRAGLRGDARRVPRRLRRPRLHGAATPTAPTRWRRIWRRAGRSGRRRSPACRSQQIEAFAALYGSTQRSYIRIGYGFARSRNGAANMHAVTCLPTVTGAWQHEGGGALWSNRGIYHWDKTLIEGLDVRDLSIRQHGHEPHRQRADRRPARTGRRAAGPRDADPEPEPGDGVPRQQPGPPWFRARRPVRLHARAVHDRDGAAGPTSCCRRRCSWSTTTSIRPAGTATSRSARS